MLAILLAAGCGGQTLQVEGTVTLDGLPVETGSISFEPQEGKGRDFGGAIENGAYKITSPAGFESGKWVVRIRASRKTGKKIPAGPPLPPGTMLDEIQFAPAIYNDRSILTADLTAGTINKVPFTLEFSPKKH